MKFVLYSQSFFIPKLDSSWNEIQGNSEAITCGAQRRSGDERRVKRSVCDNNYRNEIFEALVTRFITQILKKVPAMVDILARVDTNCFVDSVHISNMVYQLIGKIAISSSHAPKRDFNFYILFFQHRWYAISTDSQKSDPFESWVKKGLKVFLFLFLRQCCIGYDVSICRQKTRYLRIE